jgi:hypothetical protein
MNLHHSSGESVNHPTGSSTPGTRDHPTSQDPPGLLGALHLLRRGLVPVILHAPGDLLRRRGGEAIATGKEPRLPNWAKAAREHDEPALRTLWSHHPDSGVGVLLGLGENGEPGIVDVEVDDEALAAPVLARIFGAAGPPETLRFRSNKGMHYLFLLVARMAARLRDIGIVQSVLKGEQQADGSVKGDPAYLGVEIRLGALDPSRPVQLQSACPPTPKADGSPRRWEGATIAAFPEALLADLATHSRAAREHATRLGSDGQRPSPPPRPERDDLTPIEMFAHQLQVMGRTVSPSGEGYVCRCPVHDDLNPSMSFGEGDGGKLLVHCHGCGASFGEIMAAVGLTTRDANPAGQRSMPGVPRRRNVNISSTCREIDDATADDLARRRDEYVAALAANPEKLLELSRRLGISVATLRAFDVGWREDWEPGADGMWVRTGRFAWIFPEVDGKLRVVGLLRRYEDEALGKKAVRGGRRGLYVPRGWDAAAGPIFIYEGASDTAAMLEDGNCAIGRPQAMARAVLPDLVELLIGTPREILVAADNDLVGREGAVDLASGLERALGRDVLVMPPLPRGVKDYRALRALGVDDGEGRDVAR